LAEATRERAAEMVEADAREMHGGRVDVLVAVRNQIDGRACVAHPPAEDRQPTQP